MALKQGKTIGIDLGTTHTVAACHGEVLSIAPNENNPYLLPSALALPPNGEMLMGWPARARRSIDPVHTLLSTKRLIGAQHLSPRAIRFTERHPYEIVEGEEGEASIETRQGIISPVRVASYLLVHACRQMRRDPRQHRAVITIPAAFQADERKGTLHAAREAGFADVHLIEEPVATAVAYLQRANLRYGIVYDLGGGTFDACVINNNLVASLISASA